MAPLSVALLLVVVGASVALAQETQLGGKLRSGDQVVVPAGETIEGDLYASGGLVRIEGRVEGDLLAGAGQVQVAGQVTGDVMAAAGSIEISGRVGGDVRAAGGQLRVSGSVREDVFGAGGQVTLASSGEVGEDLVFGTGQMTLDGAVAGDVLGTAGTYVRRGTVGGTENVTVTEREERVPTLSDRGLAALRRLVSILAVAVLALWLAPRLIEEPAHTLRRRPLASLGVGVLGLVGFGVLVVAVILVGVLLAIGLGMAGLGALVGTVIFALVVGLAVLGFLFFLALAFGAPAGVGMSLGGLVVPSRSRVWRGVALLLGVIGVVVVSSLPVVGGWLAFLVVVLGLGALILALRPGVRRVA